MKKLLFCVFLLAAVGLRAQDITGFWRTFYDGGHRDPKSVVAVYRHDGKIYARVIIFYERGSRGQTILDDINNPRTETARNIVRIGNGVDAPAKLGGLDIIWNMTPGRGRTWIYENGFVLNPDSGNRYHARIQIDRHGDLVVRGHLGISSLLGRSMTAERFDVKDFPPNFQIPDYENFTPDLPVVK